MSRQALEAWVSEHCINASLQQHAHSTELPIEISISDILCEHGALDPTMSRDMKLLTPVCGLNSMSSKMSWHHLQHSFSQIVARTNCTFNPLLKASEVCGDCVSMNFKGYSIPHMCIFFRQYLLKNQRSSMKSSTLNTQGYLMNSLWWMKMNQVIGFLRNGVEVCDYILLRDCCSWHSRRLEINQASDAFRIPGWPRTRLSRIL